jgi:cobalt-zinc-cadmium efflux system membrane fusion protein
MRTLIWHRPAAFALWLTVAVTLVWAHEGHEALPTQGMTVQVDQGLVILSPPAREALGVETAEARREALADVLTAPATVVAPWQQSAHATTLVAGKIAAIRVQMGDRVKAGQVLADVASVDLENFQLELRTAQNEEKLAAQNLRELEEAGGQGAVSMQTLLEARAKLRETQNTLEIAGRKLRALGVDSTTIDRLLRDPASEPVATLPVVSPIDGVVSHAEARVGQVVEPTDHLFGVLDSQRVWVQIEVLEKDLARIEVAQPVTFHWRSRRRAGSVSDRREQHPTKTADTASDRSHAVITSKGLAVDPKTHTATVWAELPNPGMDHSASDASHRPLLYPGMIGMAEIAFPAKKPVLTVPASAVQEIGAERFVLLEEGPGQYVRHNLVVGRQSGSRVEVREAKLVPGDRVVTAGALELGLPFTPTTLRLSDQALRSGGVRWEPASKRRVAQVVSLPGQVDLPPDRRALVAARVAGVLQRIHVRPEQRVQAGDTIAEVVSLELQNLETELVRQQMHLDLLEQTLKQMRPLAERGNAGLSQRKYRELQSSEVATRQRRASLERKLEALGLTVEQIRDIREQRQFLAALPLRAPLAGAVVRCNATLGQAVKADEPIFEIHDPARPMIRGFVAERQRDAVRVGQAVRVRPAADPDTVLSATIVRSAQAFEADRTLSVWAELDSLDAVQFPLLSGMGARLTVVVAESAPTLAVPDGASVGAGSARSIFVRRADGTFERRSVQAGRSDDRFVEIITGLRQGEQVVVEGVAALETTLASVR